MSTCHLLRFSNPLLEKDKNTFKEFAKASTHHAAPIKAKIGSDGRQPKLRSLACCVRPIQEVNNLIKLLTRLLC